ncbi:MAG: bifunctional DNA-formamidopyrimidine glycosylase/DNA-(apurinic or apyrimidinic site) lyase [Candidatus Magasanikbacteria bacterium]|nr:bifunctional DNA-formamidopyrimidine glycosylase/DNA-(apurinic or apyrimidinic site) lyase [Candidatus Magasanikbacteria bacterium]
MPELPEVETIRRDLEKKISTKKIKDIKILATKSVHNKSAEFLKVLVGNNFSHIERRGKLLMFALDKSGKYGYMLVHLKMTGQLIYRNKDRVLAGGHSQTAMNTNVPNKFTRVIFNFSDGGQLFFNDLRRFGYIKLVSTKEKEKIVKNNFGIEPLTSDYIFEDFAKLFQKRQTNVKALLLNQKLISGIGNIYADEACFEAKILPMRKASDLSQAELKKLFEMVAQVLKVSIENRGTTFNNYVDSDGRTGSHINFLKVYGRDGEKCKKCKSIILKIKHAGRGTHYCPNCQK